MCLLASTFVFGIANSYFRRNNKTARIDYSGGISEISSTASNIVNEINSKKLSINDKDNIMEAIQSRYRGREDLKILILDLDGKILYKTDNVSETNIDVYSLIKNALEQKENLDSRKEYVSFSPLQFTDTRAYVVVKAIPYGHITYYQTGGNSFLALLISCGSFVIIFMFITKNRMLYFEEIAKGIIEISKGNLDYRINKSGNDELAVLSDSVNLMASELQRQIEAERRAEKTKNELITNVSHDLRTPLTSIMGYLGLIKESKYSSTEEMKEYVNIAFNKSEKLKVLIEDLFEYTKLSSEGIKLYHQPVAVNEFLDQLVEELVPICEENEITIVKHFPNEKVILNLDVDKTLRVFENLIINAIKYTAAATRDKKVINFNVEEGNSNIILSIEDNGIGIPKEDLGRVYDAFFTGKNGRKTSESTGMGMYLAKRICEELGHELCVESEEGKGTKFSVAFYKVKNIFKL
jgi:signal transduction histidine kinase